MLLLLTRVCWRCKLEQGDQIFNFGFFNRFSNCFQTFTKNASFRSYLPLVELIYFEMLESTVTVDGKQLVSEMQKTSVTACNGLGGTMAQVFGVKSEGSGFESYSEQIIQNEFLVINKAPKHSFIDRQHWELPPVPSSEFAREEYACSVKFKWTWEGSWSGLRMLLCQHEKPQMRFDNNILNVIISKKMKLILW